MFCKFCGKENKNGQKFCKYCGERLQMEMDPAAQERSARPKKVISIIIIASAVMIILALGVFVGLHLGHGGDSADKQDETVNDVSTDNAEAKSLKSEKKILSESADVWKNVYSSELDDIKESYHRKMAEYLTEMYGGDAENSNRTNTDFCMRFELLDVNNDGIPELFSYDSEGIVAWITTCKDGTAVSTILYDNTVKPSGFTDYGAYASIDAENNRIYRYEYDTTLNENSGMNRPGAEWIEIDNRPFEYYIYVTTLEIGNGGEITETDRYTCHFHYDRRDENEYGSLERTEGDFVDATHNGASISKDEFDRIEAKHRPYINFGSGQDGANGYSAEDIRELLDNEKLRFTVNYINENSSEAELFRIEDEIPDYSCTKHELLSDLPSGIREGDFLAYSINDGWSADDTQEILSTDDGRNEAYAQIVRDYYKKNASHAGGTVFDLIYFDEDDLPELVTCRSGENVSLYTFSDGEVIQMCDDWPYGAWGNSGYEYFPKESIIFNSDSDYAGAMYWETYMRWNPDTRQFEDLNDKPLSVRRFDDRNGNGEPDDDEFFSDDAELLYYYGDTQISEEEYKSHGHDGETDSLCGSLTYEQILGKLGYPVGESISIVGASATSELNVASKDNATYLATNICDGDLKTAWVEGADGNGEGQSITLYLDGVHNISRLKIYNGYLKNKRRYSINGKVTKAVIDYGNGYQQHVDVHTIFVPEEETDFEPYEIIETIVIPDQEVSTDTITFTIEEADSGSKYQDTAVSEIIVYEK